MVGRASRVLVNGAGGGVGTFAIQLAKLQGACHWRARELPAIQHWEEEMRAIVSHFVAEAPLDLRLDERRHTIVSALFDLPSFMAFRLRGIGVEEARHHAVAMAISWLNRASQKPG